mmetsp:Transcript_10484/g.15057  ORF Transcript_10484/g.15057 Transcript_10484/m.15057 type:complete len:121 (+) Transcript_10484:180-542(+)
MCGRRYSSGKHTLQAQSPRLRSCTTRLRLQTAPTLKFCSAVLQKQKHSSLQVSTGLARISGQGREAGGGTKKSAAKDSTKFMFDHTRLMFHDASTDPAYLPQAWPTLTVASVQRGGTSSL